MTIKDEEQESGGVAPAIVGSVAIAFLLLAALFAGAIPYTISLVGLAQLPPPFGLQEFDTSDLVIAASIIFLLYALSEIPSDIAGRFVTISLSMKDAPSKLAAMKPRRKLQGRLTSQLLQALVLVLLLSVWVTNSFLGALFVALITATLEFILDPILDRYVEKRPDQSLPS